MLRLYFICTFRDCPAHDCVYVTPDSGSEDRDSGRRLANARQNVLSPSPALGELYWYSCVTPASHTVVACSGHFALMLGKCSCQETA